MKRIYKLEGWKAYEGSTLLGVFETLELAERAKELAKKITEKYSFDDYEVYEIVLHTHIPAWRKLFTAHFTVSRKRIRRAKYHRH